MSADDAAWFGAGVRPANADRSALALLIHQIADRAPQVMLVAAAPDFRIVYANKAAHRSARSAAGELVGRVVSEVFPFVDPARLASQLPSRALARAAADRSTGAVVCWDVSYDALGAAPPGAACVLVTAVDVTHHAEARARAEAAQHTLDALLAYIPEGISIAHGPEIRVDRISAQGLALVGRDAAELTGRSALLDTVVWEVYRPGSDVPLSPADRPLARATRTGKVMMNETLIMRRSDGRLLTVLCNSGPIFDTAGHVTGAVMAWRDVSELQSAQNALRESERHLRAVLLQIPAAIFILEAPDGRVTFQSRMLDEVLGHLDGDHEKAKAALRGWAVHEDGTPYELMEYPSRRALFRGETVRAEPLSFLRPDGRLVNLEMHAGPVHSETGEIIAAVAVAMDVTERRLAEARQAFLFRLQDSLRALSDPAEILTTAATLLGRHLEVARIGYSELQPDDATVLVTNGFVNDVPPVNGLFPISRLGPRHAAHIRQGRTLVCEDAQADTHGAAELGLELGIRGHVSVPLVRGGRYTGSLYVTDVKPRKWSPPEIALIEEVAGRIWDAAERGRAEARLRESEERLEQQVRERTAELMATEETLRQSQKMEAVGQLTGGLAHDFNNLLAGISGSLELMARRLEQGKVAGLDRYLRLAREAAQRAASLTHRLLAFSRRQTLDPKPTDINQLVHGMDELIRRTVGPGVALEVIGAPELWTVRADPNQLENALLNLCINSRDAMPDGGRLTIATGNRVLTDIEAKELQLPGEEFVSLSVSDTGGGMTADVIERAFDPFFTTKPIGEGTGLGLSMVYGFVRQSGGQARIRSQPGTGTEVCLYLPRHIGSDEQPEPSCYPRKSVRSEGETVLVVDDESSVRTLIDEVLQELGYTVLQAELGAGGLQILESRERVDLLITDVGLPGGMNGRQLADAALVRRPDLKVLFITGYAENAVIGDCHLKPGMHVLIKPFSLETLGSRIREIFAAT
jgi:PAS domain S-box-containing protein